MKYSIPMKIPNQYQTNCLLKEISTFGIGGPAKYFVEVRTIPDMQKTLLFCYQNEIPYFILGKGSNSLFDDRGFNGLVIANRIDCLEKNEKGCWHVGAGYSFSLLGSQTARQGWEGLEFASGIPGSVGGAIFMNAGANGRETADNLISVDFVDEQGKLIHFKRSNLNFQYRTSPFQNIKGAIVSATFQLNASQEARQKQLSIIDYRKKTQPYKAKSAGCVFRNPNCGHAGALIEQAGLKETKIGGAAVSSVHANFIINSGLATSQDVLALIRLIQETVKAKTGAELESEIRYVPYDVNQG
ncbi:UDP-N-acetylmuramate dehydrogenase [Candidatus Protochlamydia amoebophila]|nr:UDP-N-acetylmuramate dehydrogenase [Candidatus Protochlamydia amoebophila]